jgi:hypothetical protein
VITLPLLEQKNVNEAVDQISSKCSSKKRVPILRMKADMNIVYGAECSKKIRISAELKMYDGIRTTKRPKIEW